MTEKEEENMTGRWVGMEQTKNDERQTDRQTDRQTQTERERKTIQTCPGSKLSFQIFAQQVMEI